MLDTETQFTAYDFMILFSTISAIKDIHSFSKDNLLDYIANKKNLNKYEELLSDINLKSDDMFYSSKDLDEAISKLKTDGILYTIDTEKNSSIFICEDFDISRIIKPRVDYITESVNFVSDYQKYETKKISEVYNQIYNQENKDIDAAVLRLTKK